MTETTTGLLEDYWAEDEFAKQVRKCLRTVQRWRQRRIGPPVTWVGRDPYYRKEAARTWLLNREVPMVRERKRG